MSTNTVALSYTVWKNGIGGMDLKMKGEEDDSNLWASKIIIFILRWSIPLSLKNATL